MEEIKLRDAWAMLHYVAMTKEGNYPISEETSREWLEECYALADEAMKVREKK